MDKEMFVSIIQLAHEQPFLVGIVILAAIAGATQIVRYVLNFVLAAWGHYVDVGGGKTDDEEES